ncbi:hypothetical protein ACLBX9_32345 [Methylobacterium sp. A49B]|uniref:O-antigen ligase family protein n=1 Tax=Methylobacterium mesophilicum SR1.6/6 TaxID=908290 RepID=A0A6B9FLE8_9HYPH|nr:hypothetical protein [Methylobacterium mesophilicum]QGY02749.1 hypothetical protein MMSR116_13310 [Methylobacterium mesophilicum SR1.6/6]
MSIEPIGAITFILGLICLLLGTRAIVIAFLVVCVLGSAAAILFGSTGIAPAHVFLIFLVLANLSYRDVCAKVLNQLRFPEPGFWLLCLFLYGVASSYIMPRLFAGQTQIIPLGASSNLPTSEGTVPLGPVSSNLNQSIYMLGNIVCFTIIAAVGSTREGIDTVTKALIAFCLADICFGLIDVITAATGTQDALKFIRNAQYTFHDDETVGNMRRIIGSYTEASAFAWITLGVFGFTGTLFLYGRKPLISGLLALSSLLFIVLSTSSTGLVGSAMVASILYMIAFMRCSTRLQDRFSAATVIACPLLLIICIVLVLSIDGVGSAIYDYVDTLVISKSTTQSGAERGTWNTYALRNLFDSGGLGVGLGTSRASSFPLAVLSQVGIPGAIFYVLFLVSVFRNVDEIPRSYTGDIRAAARVGCISLIFGAMISGTTVDLGLLFYVFAGCACSASYDRQEASHGMASAYQL